MAFRYGALLIFMKTVDLELWKNKAVAAAVKAEKMLWGKHNEDIQAWMYEAGFALETIRNAHLGWQVRNTMRPGKSWGLEGCEKIHLPEGITLPVIRDKRLQRLVIYRMDQGHAGQYHTVEGSARIPLALPGKKSHQILVAREMDALLLHQELKGESHILAVEDFSPQEVEPFLVKGCVTCLLLLNTPLPLWEKEALHTLKIKADTLMELARNRTLETAISSLR